MILEMIIQQLHRVVCWFQRLIRHAPSIQNFCSTKIWSLYICFNRKSTLIFNYFLMKYKDSKYSIVEFFF